MVKGSKLTQVQLENCAFLFFITVCALLMRFVLFPFESSDYHQFLQGWYDSLKLNGGFAAVGMNIGDYMPTYLYLLAAFTYFPVSGLTAVKLISSAADLVLAVYVCKIVSLKYKNPVYGITAYAVTLFLPSVFLNSAVWGQCDSIYTAALAAFLYHMMLGHQNRSAAAFGVAFSFKLQAVFLAPFLLLLLFKRKIRPVKLLFIPLVYFISIIPAVLAGGSFFKLLTVYFFQAKQYSMLNMFLPNLYTWLPKNTPYYISCAAMLFAGAVVAIALFCLCRASYSLDGGTLVSLALFFALLLPFVLPHMHERYYYVADILSLVYAFYFPKRMYVAAVIELSSAYAVCHNLFATDFIPVQYPALLILFVLIMITVYLVGEIRSCAGREVRAAA